MAYMNGSGRKRAASDPYLRVLVEFLAWMLALPLNSQGIGNIVGEGRIRRGHQSYADKDGD